MARIGGPAIALAATTRAQALGDAVHSFQSRHRPVGDVRAAHAPTVDWRLASSGNQARVRYQDTVVVPL